MPLSLQSQWPPGALRKTIAQNEQPLLAEIATVLAGNAAAVVGHTVGGADLQEGDPNHAPRNPSGDVGHDHSGGEFGRPLFRSVASFHLDDDQTLSVHVAGQTTTFILDTPTAGADADNSTEDRRPILYAWVPPCAGAGAYVDLGLNVVGDYSASQGATAMQAGDVVKVRFTQLHRALLAVAPTDAAGLIAAELTLASPQTSSAGKRMTSTATTSTRLRVVPGSINPIAMSITASRDATAGNRYPWLMLREVELGVYDT